MKAKIKRGKKNALFLYKSLKKLWNYLMIIEKLYPNRDKFIEEDIKY